MKKRPNKIIHLEGSICWNCSHACMGCVKPVEGWNAVFNPLYSFDAKRKIDSWYVVSCPNYDPEKDNIVFVHGSKFHNMALLPFEGKMITETDFADMLGIKLGSLCRYLQRGMTPEQIAKKYMLTENGCSLEGICVKTGERKVWKNISEAVKDKQYKFTRGPICKVISKEQKTHNGWVFAFVRE